MKTGVLTNRFLREISTKGKKILLAVLVFFIFLNSTFAQFDPSTQYYSKSTGDLHNLLTWGLNPNGSGANPPDFGAGKTFNLVNRGGAFLVPGFIMTGDWTVGGTINLGTWYPSTTCGSPLAINGFTLTVSHLTGFGCGPGSYLGGGKTSNLIITGDEPGNEIFTFASVRSPYVLELNNLTIDRPGNAASVTLSSPVAIYGVLNLVKGSLSIEPSIFAIAPGLRIESDAINTARIAPIPPNSRISGKVMVDRYVPARRAWRLLSSPVGQSIHDAWQNGETTFSPKLNPYRGGGTHITQSVSNGDDGLDFNPAGATSSLKRYSNPTNTWLPVLNTRSTFTSQDAWFIFVRGDRTINLGFNNVPANNTLLSAEGALNVGDQTFPIAASGLNAIPNPYASPLNFASIAAHNPNIVNSFTVVDPKLGSTGAFVNVSFNPTTSTYEVTPAAASPINEIIQSGQGFLVQSKGVAGSLVIKETDKSQTAATDVFRLADGSTERQAVATSKGLRINLQAKNDGNYEVLDEVFSSYNEGYSNGLDDLDAIKAANPEENLGIVTEGKTVMVDRRKPIAENDVIQLRLWNTNERDYVLKFNPINLSSIKVPALVFDNYNKTYTPIDLNNETKISFTVTADATSKDPYRFKVVFSDKKVNAQMVVTSEMIRVVPNPINDRTINLQLSDLPQGIYGVQLLDNTGRIVHSSKLSYPGGNGTQKINLNNKLIKGVYQLRLSSDKFSKTLKIFSN